MFVSPLQAKAGAGEKIRLTVFILNDQGLGVSGKQITLGEVGNLTINETQVVTDSFGKAIFDISSPSKGDYYILVSVSGQVLPQKAHILFN